MVECNTNTAALAKNCENKARLSMHCNGKLYGFFAKKCKESFVKDPGQYIRIKKQ